MLTCYFLAIPYIDSDSEDEKPAAKPIIAKVATKAVTKDESSASSDSDSDSKDKKPASKPLVVAKTAATKNESTSDSSDSGKHLYMNSCNRHAMRQHASDGCLFRWQQR